MVAKKKPRRGVNQSAKRIVSAGSLFARTQTNDRAVTPWNCGTYTRLEEILEELRRTHLESRDAKTRPTASPSTRKPTRP